MKTLGSYQIEKLTKLIDVLERKSLVKMEALRKDFITFGSLSTTRAFGYYQIITFLKQVKELVNKIKKQNFKTNKASNNLSDNSSNALFKEKIRSVIRAKSKQKKNITQKLIKE